MKANDRRCNKHRWFPRWAEKNDHGYPGQRHRRTKKARRKCLYSQDNAKATEGTEKHLAIGESCKSTCIMEEAVQRCVFAV